MRHTILTLAAVTCLAATPVLASEPGRDAELNRRGLLAGGATGALVAGPPGLIAGAMLGGFLTDREVKVRRHAELENELAVLAVEQENLRARESRHRARQSELEQRLQEQQALATHQVDAGVLTGGLEFSVGFRTASADLPEHALGALDALAGLLAAVPGMELRLDGYADPRGSSATNQALSEARAAAIRAYLVGVGVAPERMRATGHGAAQSLLPEGVADPDGWALQRRVSIRLDYPVDGLAAQR